MPDPLNAPTADIATRPADPTATWAEPDLGPASLADLFLLYGHILDELQRREVVRTRNQPLGDYAEWTYHGILFRNVLQGSPNAAYALKHYPVPNSLTTLGLGLLMLLLPWQLAAKIWLLIGLCLGLVAAYVLGNSTGS